MFGIFDNFLQFDLSNSISSDRLYLIFQLEHSCCMASCVYKQKTETSILIKFFFNFRETMVHISEYLRARIVDNASYKCPQL